MSDDQEYVIPLSSIRNRNESVLITNSFVKSLYIEVPRLIEMLAVLCPECVVNQKFYYHVLLSTNLIDICSSVFGTLSLKGCDNTRERQVLHNIIFCATRIVGVAKVYFDSLSSDQRNQILCIDLTK